MADPTEAVVLDQVVHPIEAEEESDYDSSLNEDSGLESDDIDERWRQLMEEHAYEKDKLEHVNMVLRELGADNYLRFYLSSQAERKDPHAVRNLLLGLGIIPPIIFRHPAMPDAELLPFTRVALERMVRKRHKLQQYNSVSDAVELLRSAKNIIVLSGAGISTSCGIPDFRSASGLYANLQAEGKYDLDDPQQMFDIRYFIENPEVFYSFAKQIYPSNFTPSPCHRWIKMLEDRGVLLRNYTQNIDTLESLAGVERVLQCHGSFKTASCLRCRERVPGQAIESYIMSSQIPYCGPCRTKRDAELEVIKRMREAKEKAKGKGKARATFDDSDSDEDVDEWGGGLPGIIKPDITFFGQALDDEFDQCLREDREKVDLLVIIGTSLKVAPVSEVLTHIPHSVPQILINLTPVTHVETDISLIGDADSIVSYLSHELDWKIPPPGIVSSPLADVGKKEAKDDILYQTDKSKLAPDLAVDPKDATWTLLGGPRWPHIHVLGDRTQAPPTEDEEVPAWVSVGGTMVNVNLMPWFTSDDEDSDLESSDEAVKLGVQVQDGEDDGEEEEEEAAEGTYARQTTVSTDGEEGEGASESALETFATEQAPSSATSTPEAEKSDDSRPSKRSKVEV